ncbi:MAG TPA: dihydroorotate dehydrogenase electron transfer subunit [Gammaproteobacteria bacterium]|nr:dihydroorotate dehydrogenase electron transfer subunit [Gammaproteobacteria bacterium]
MSTKPHRDTLFVEEAKVLSQTAYPGDQYVLRVQAPQCATHAMPGSFVHVSCDPELPMRRPMSIMRVSRQAGWVEMLYKAIGGGTGLLSKRHVGEQVSLIGPIGNGFSLHPKRPRPLLIGGGVGIPPMIFVADELRHDKRTDWKPFVIMGSEVPFPFQAKPSRFIVPGIPDGVIAAMPLLEDWGIASRLASWQGYAGCFEGFVTDLARHWLDALDAQQRDEVEILTCGPTPMLKAVAALAKEYELPCQASLEEFMACAVGGCAGCTVEVQTENGPAMKRVCVDGPVFDAATVF